MTLSLNPCRYAARQLNQVSMLFEYTKAQTVRCDSFTERVVVSLDRFLLKFCEELSSLGERFCSLAVISQGARPNSWIAFLPRSSMQIVSHIFESDFPRRCLLYNSPVRPLQILCSSKTVPYAAAARIETSRLDKVSHHSDCDLRSRILQLLSTIVVVGRCRCFASTFRTWARIDV